MGNMKAVQAVCGQIKGVAVLSVRIISQEDVILWDLES